MMARQDWPYPLGVAQIAGQVPLWRMAGKLKQPIVKEIAEHSLTVIHMTEALPDAGTGWAFVGDRIGAYTDAAPSGEDLRKDARSRRAGFRQGGLSRHPRAAPGRFLARDGQRDHGRR